MVAAPGPPWRGPRSMSSRSAHHLKKARTSSVSGPRGSDGSTLGLGPCSVKGQSSRKAASHLASCGEGAGNAPHSRSYPQIGHPFLSHFIPRFLGAILAFLLLTLAGTVGYIWIENVSTLDSIYMTVITLTAVGYQEVFPLSVAGRSFTMALLLAGITWLGSWFALITSFLLELDLKDALRRRRLVKDIEKLNGHVILCGAGRTGRQVAQELDEADKPFIVVDHDQARLDDLHEYLPDALTLEGDATHDQVLLDAGLARASGLITCLSADADNLFVCLSARDLAAQVTIVARAYEEETLDKLYRAGANHVVSPNVSGAIRMASMLLRPSVVSFLEIATRSSEMALRVEEAEVKDGSRVAGRTLEEARIPQHTGLIVIAVKKLEAAGQGFIFNPVGSTLVEAGDRVIVLGQPEQIDSLQAFTG